MPKFDINQEINNLIQRSGGLIAYSPISGRPENMGITLRLLTMYIARQASVRDLETLSKQTARDIHYVYHYIKPNINALPDLIKPIMLDTFACHGQIGITMLQDALIPHGYDIEKLDGYIGTNTASAAQRAVDEIGNELIRGIIRRRIAFYECQVKNDETLRVFLANWIKRVECFLPDAIA